jgi:hypothetical protein
MLSDAPSKSYSKECSQEPSLGDSQEHSQENSQEQKESKEHSLEPSHVFPFLSTILFNKKVQIYNDVEELELQIPIKKSSLKYFNSFSDIEKSYFLKNEKIPEKNEKNEKVSLSHKTKLPLVPLQEMHCTPLKIVRSPVQINHVRTMDKLFHFNIIENKIISEKNNLNEKNEKNDEDYYEKKMKENSDSLSYNFLPIINNNNTIINTDINIKNKKNISFIENISSNVARIKIDMVTVESNSLITRLLKHRKNSKYRGNHRKEITEKNITVHTDLKVKNELNYVKESATQFLNFHVFKDPETLDRKDSRLNFISKNNIENENYIFLELHYSY